MKVKSFVSFLNSFYIYCCEQKNKPCQFIVIQSPELLQNLSLKMSLLDGMK